MRIVALAALTLLLTGCVPAEPAVTPVPVPSGTPLFASDADALKAATDAYAAYLAMSDRITADGGASPERIAPFVTKSKLKDEIAGYDKYTANRFSTTGNSSFDNVTLEQIQLLSGGQTEITVYLCSNISGIRLMSGSGDDITPASREDRRPFEATFVSPKNKHTLLVLSRNSPWSGSGIC